MLYDGDIFERGGRRFRFETESDDMGPPWEEHDGHGVVSDGGRCGSSQRRRTGELVLSSDQHAERYYDFRETMALAKKDGWGCADMTDDAMRDAIAVLQELEAFDRELVEDEQLEPEGAYVFDPAEIEQIKLAVAVNADFKYLKSWCDDEWSWVGVVVTLIETDEYGDEVDGESASLWGLRSDDDAYLEEVAHELADDITDQLDATAVADMMAARPDLYPVES